MNLGDSIPVVAAARARPRPRASTTARRSGDEARAPRPGRDAPRAANGEVRSSFTVSAPGAVPAPSPRRTARRGSAGPVHRAIADRLVTGVLCMRTPTTCPRPAAPVEPRMIAGRPIPRSPPPRGSTASTFLLEQQQGKVPRDGAAPTPSPESADLSSSSTSTSASAAAFRPAAAARPARSRAAAGTEKPTAVFNRHVTRGLPTRAQPASFTTTSADHVFETTPRTTSAAIARASLGGSPAPGTTLFATCSMRPRSAKTAPSPGRVADRPGGLQRHRTAGVPPHPPRVRHRRFTATYVRWWHGAPSGRATLRAEGRPMTADRHARTMLPIPDRPAPGPDDLRREGPGHVVPADRAAAAAGGRAERADRPARRRRVRGVERVRRSVPDARRPSGWRRVA